MKNYFGILENPSALLRSRMKLRHMRLLGSFSQISENIFSPCCVEDTTKTLRRSHMLPVATCHSPEIHQ